MGVPFGRAFRFNLFVRTSQKGFPLQSVSFPKVGPFKNRKSLLFLNNNYENNKQVCEQKLIERAIFFDWKKAAGEYLNVYNMCVH